VTFGAGGSTRDRTLETVRDIQASGSEAAPHLSCIGSTQDNIREILNEYKSQGIRHLVALRGDLPSGSMDAGEFNYANELVSFIRAETGDWFEIEVAAYPEIHPQARSWTDDLANFKRKVDAGADSAITQYFFNADAYFRFVDEAHALGVSIPIVPGIMRSETMCNSRGFQMPAARRSHAGCERSWKPTAMTWRRSAPSDWMSSLTSASACWPVVHRVCISTP